MRTVIVLNSLDVIEEKRKVKYQLIVPLRLKLVH